MTASWSAWYATNREEYLKRLRDKYKKDSKYRKQAIERAQDSNDSRGDYWKNPDSVRLPISMQIQMLDGVQTKMLFPISWLAKRVKRQAQLVRHWERNGTLPMTPYRLTRGGRDFRLYTDEMIGAVASVIRGVEEVRKMGKKQKSEISDHIAAGWRKVGVPVAEREVSDGHPSSSGRQDRRRKAVR